MSADVGLVFPDAGAEDVLPLGAGVLSDGFAVFSIAFAAAAFEPAPSSSGISFFPIAGAAGVGVPMERTLALGAGESPPNFSTFGAALIVAVGFADASPAPPDDVGAPASGTAPALGLFAITGACLCCCCCG